MEPVPPPITFAEAARRTAATAVQALGAFLVTLAGLIVAGRMTATTVGAAACGTVLVPVATALQRYAEAWRHAREGGG